MSKELKSLYVASHDYTTLTKVGVSKEPTKRLNAIRTAAGAEMFLYYESPPLKNWSQIEQIILKHFHIKRVSGEWINEKPDKIVKYIKSIENLFNSENYCSLIEDIEPEIEKLSEYTLSSNNIETFFESFNLTHTQNGVYRDDNYIFYVLYHIGSNVVLATFNVFRSANKFAKEAVKRIILLDLENKQFIYNDKFRIKNEQKKKNSK